MPTITASTNDGYQSSGLDASWDNAHDAVGNSNPDINNATDINNGIRYEYVTARGPALYYLTRAFFDFDTSGISVAPSAATFNLKIYANNACTPCMVVKSGHDPATATDDWFSTWITGQGITLSGWSAGDITRYSGATTIGSVGAFTSFAFNASGLSDIASLDLLKIGVLHNNDVMDVAPTSGTLRTGVYWADHGTAGNRPYLDYTAGVAVTDNATFFGTNF